MQTATRCLSQDMRPAIATQQVNPNSRPHLRDELSRNTSATKRYATLTIRELTLPTWEATYWSSENLAELRRQRRVL